MTQFSPPVSEEARRNERAFQIFLAGLAQGFGPTSAPQAFELLDAFDAAARQDRDARINKRHPHETA